MSAGNSSSRPSGRSSGRSNSSSSGKSGTGRPSGRSGPGRPSSGGSAGRSGSGSRAGSGRPSSGSGRPAGGSRSGTSRPASGRSSSTSGPGRSSGRSVDARGTARPTRDGARTDSRGAGRPRRDDARTDRSRRDEGRPTRDGARTDRPRRDDARSDRPRRDDARNNRSRRDDTRGAGRPGRDGERRPSRDGDRRPRRDFDRDDRAPRSRRPDSDAPAIPDHITGEELHRSIRNELRSLPDGLALRVARHLAACIEIATDDPELAWKHAKAAFDMASRIAVVRETAADAAYNAGHFAEALSHYRAVKRMTGKKDYWPVMADCERALGRPQKAIAMAADPIVASLSLEARVEMRIVVAGARLDQNNPEAALATLQCSELNKPSTEPWAARIRYAYADTLTKLGREAEAIEWFHRTAAVDVDQFTDADERIAELEGETETE